MVSFLYETKQARQEKNHTKTNCSHLLLSKTTQMQKHSQIFKSDQGNQLLKNKGYDAMSCIKISAVQMFCSSRQDNMKSE